MTQSATMAPEQQRQSQEQLEREIRDTREMIRVGERAVKKLAEKTGTIFIGRPRRAAQTK